LEIRVQASTPGEARSVAEELGITIDRADPYAVARIPNRFEEAPVKSLVQGVFVALVLFGLVQAAMGIALWAAIAGR